MEQTPRLRHGPGPRPVTQAPALSPGPRPGRLAPRRKGPTQGLRCEDRAARTPGPGASRAVCPEPHSGGLCNPRGHDPQPGQAVGDPDDLQRSKSSTCRAAVANTQHPRPHLAPQEGALDGPAMCSRHRKGRRRHVRCPSSGPVAAGLAWTPRVLTPARHHAAPAGQREAHGRSPEGGAHPQLSRPPRPAGSVGTSCPHQEG